MPDIMLLDLGVTVFDNRPAPTETDPDTYRAIALVAARMTLAKAVKSALDQLDIPSPVRKLSVMDIPVPAMAGGAGGPVPATSLRDHQADFFRSKGLEIPSVLHLVIPFEGGKVEIYMNDGVETFGSFHIQRVVKVVVSAGQGVAKTLILPLVVGSMLGWGKPMIQPERYYCTVEVVVKGDVDQLVRAAAEDLEMPADASEDVQRRVWAARQRCLRAAGANVGEIDGIPGPMTQHGTEEFSSAHGGVLVDWESAVFRQFVVREGMRNAAQDDE